jgi:NAD(P)-dependent dehydrogenase (short-subunit alcohol dehydrogenase family)
VRTAIDRFGTVDIIINNAGTFGGNLAFHATKLEDFRRLIGVHLFGTAALTHAAWPVMMEKRYGRVIMTASSAGLWGIENVSSYCAAKGGHHRTRQIARTRRQGSNRVMFCLSPRIKDQERTLFDH